jgi:hypothetical protein
MSVYYFELTESDTKGTFRVQANNFWQAPNSFVFDILVNYVIFGIDIDTRGHYSFGNIFIQSNNNPSRTDGYWPKLIINQVKNNQISIINDPNGSGEPTDPESLGGVQWIKINGGITGKKYAMKCTVI